MAPFSDSGDNSFVVQLKEVKYVKEQRQPQKFPDPDCRNTCHGSGLGWHRNNSDAIWLPFIYDSLCTYQLQMYYI